MSMHGLHRLAGGLHARRLAALDGPCHMCRMAGNPNPRASVGFIESWDLDPKGVCEQHAEQGRRLRYTIHTREELT